MTTRGIEAALWATATRDGEVRTSKSGNEFGTLSLMLQDGSVDADGKQVTTFVRVLAFGVAHVEIARGIRKGDRVYTEGSLAASIWTPAGGVARLDLTIKAFKLERTAIGKNRPPREPADKPAPAPKAAARDWQAPPGGFDETRGDDVGF